MPNLFPASALDWSPETDATIDTLLSTLPAGALQAGTAALQDLYRGERTSTPLANIGHLALAYLAARLPTTFQTIRHVLQELPDDFTPTTQLDLGAGPGTASLAARDLWPDISATLIEREHAFISIAAKLLPGATVNQQDLHNAGYPTADLVTLGYVINELAPDNIAPLVQRAWQATRGALVIIETGTPHGYAQLMAARNALLQIGANITAPCPHQLTCPLIGKNDWCHFALRAQRSPHQRTAKGAPLPYEDEKFCYLIACRAEAAEPHRRINDKNDRIIKAPHRAGGHVTLDLCTAEGVNKPALFSRRDGVDYKAARQKMWGEIIPRD